MKRFQMITESDARVLEFGSAIVLVRGGHVTPLALDTLRERRISVVRESGAVAAGSLAPTADIRRVAVAGDHTSLTLKTAIVEHLRSRGIAAYDLGTTTSESVDYPDTAAAAATSVARGEADAGIVIDGAGSARRSRRTKCLGSARRCASTRRSRATHVSTTARTSLRWERRS